MTLYYKIRTLVAKRAQYVRKKDEIASMRLVVVLDLGIFREDAAKIAHKAVYG